MNLVAVQLDIAWEDQQTNFAGVRALLAEAPPEKGSLILLPEMFASGFSMDISRIAEAPGGPTEGFLAEIAQAYGSFVLGGMVSQTPAGRGRNEAVAFGPDGLRIARYAKLHPFSYAKETDYFDSGDEIVTFPCGDFTVAPFVCYDLRFPEVFRAAVRQGATLFPVIANWPQARAAHWPALLRARAIENQAYVVGVNRCGNDPNVGYAGDSILFDPKGECLAEAGSEACVILAETGIHFTQVATSCSFQLNLRLEFSVGLCREEADFDIRVGMAT